MPREWHDRHAVNKLDNDEQRELYRAIVADKKPYFMRYIYPSLAKQYNQFVKNTDRKALREFGMTVAELQSLPVETLSEEQSEFLAQYAQRLPVSADNCVVNIICRRFEDEFDRYFSKYGDDAEFDYRKLKSNVGYTRKHYLAVQRILADYDQRLADIQRHSVANRDKSSATETAELRREFRRECDIICPNGDALCDIVLDLCYNRSKTKAFAWGVCGTEIINNLLRNNGGVASFPVRDADGDIVFGLDRFSMQTVMLGGSI